jgi:molybdate transport system regulatory protein
VEESVARNRTRPKSHQRRPALGAGSSRERFQLAGRLWVEKEGETYLGWGRAVLLQRIAETGSLSQAARAMGMGYRHAWELVDRMNRLSPRPLVTTAAGGRNGGGSRLTPEGEAAVENFWTLVDDFQQWLKSRDPRMFRPRRMER